MLKNNLCFPYPILRTESIDYKEGIISFDVEKNIVDNSYELITQFTTNNNTINTMIGAGYAKKYLLVESGALKYKKMFDITTNNRVVISSNDVYGKVEIQPCIVCNKHFNNFYSPDFYDEYKGIEINLKKGDIIGIGDVYEFDALLEKDVQNNVSSIFAIDEGTKDYIYYDDDGDQVVIYLPKNMKIDYQNNGLLTKTHSILNSIVVFPILVELVKKVIDGSDMYIENKWFITIKKKIDDLIDKNIISQNENDTYRISQYLVSSIQESALNDLRQIIDQWEGEK